MDDPPAGPPPVLIVPSDRVWIDPRLLARNLYVQQRTVNLVGTTPTQLAGLNYDRWGIGVAALSSLMTGLYVAPWADVSDVSGQNVRLSGWAWWDQLSYGPMIGGEWWGYATFAGTARVVEVIRLT